jgi:hypothetical protein
MILHVPPAKDAWLMDSADLMNAQATTSVKV